jgi:hypothetical protein
VSPQADIVAALIRQGAAVHAFNQRAIAEIFDMIRLLGALVGAADRAGSTRGQLSLRPVRFRARVRRDQRFEDARTEACPRYWAPTPICLAYDGGATRGRASRRLHASQSACTNAVSVI